MLQNEAVAGDRILQPGIQCCSRVLKSKAASAVCILDRSPSRSIGIEGQGAIQRPRTASSLRRVLKPCWFPVTVSPKIHGVSSSTRFEADVELGGADQYGTNLSRLMIMRTCPGSRFALKSPMRIYYGHGVDGECHTGLRESGRLYRENHVHVTSVHDRNLGKSTDSAWRGSCMPSIQGNKHPITGRTTIAEGLRTKCDKEELSQCIIIYLHRARHNLDFTDCRPIAISDSIATKFMSSAA